MSFISGPKSGTPAKDIEMVRSKLEADISSLRANLALLSKSGAELPISPDEISLFRDISEKFFNRAQLTEIEAKELFEIREKMADASHSMIEAEAQQMIDLSHIVETYQSVINDSRISRGTRNKAISELDSLMKEMSLDEGGSLSYINLRRTNRLIDDARAKLGSSGRKIKYSELNEKADMAVRTKSEVNLLDNEYVNSAKTSIREAFLSNPGQYSAGEVRKSAISATLESFGLGGLDSLFGASEKIDSALGNLWKDITHKSEEDAEKIVDATDSASKSSLDKLDKINDSLDTLIKGQTRGFDEIADNQDITDATIREQSKIEERQLAEIRNLSDVTDSPYSKSENNKGENSGGGGGGLLDTLDDLNDLFGGKKGSLSKIGSKLSGLARFAPKAAGPLTALAVGGTAVYDYATSEDEASRENAIGTGVGGVGGALAGGKLGAMAGAAIGSVVPIVGTAGGAIVGGIVGAAGGAFLGTEAGQEVASWFSDPEDLIPDNVKALGKEAEAEYIDKVLMPQLSAQADIEGSGVSASDVADLASYRNEIAPVATVTATSEVNTDGLTETVDTATTATETIGNGLQSMADYLAGLPGIGPFFSGLSTVKKVISLPAVSGFVSSVSSAVSGAGQKVLDTAGTTVDSLRHAASNVLPGNDEQKKRGQDLLAYAKSQGLSGDELSLFMGQVSHESGNFKYYEELASGSAYEGRKDLGNTEAGDGKRFKGRGPIQITGRANYEKYGKMIGVDLVNNPELASDPEIGNKLAVAYWKDRVQPSLEEKGSTVEAATKAVNGGYNGLEDRKAKTAEWSAEIARQEKEGNSDLELATSGTKTGRIPYSSEHLAAMSEEEKLSEIEYRKKRLYEMQEEYAKEEQAMEASVSGDVGVMTATGTSSSLVGQKATGRDATGSGTPIPETIKAPPTLAEQRSMEDKRMESVMQRAVSSAIPAPTSAPSSPPAASGVGDDDDRIDDISLLLFNRSVMS
jgi:hypothetical protein